MAASPAPTASAKHPMEKLRAADEDVVDGDVDELHDVADDTHDDEADADSLRDLDEFPLSDGLAGARRGVETGVPCQAWCSGG